MAVECESEVGANAQTYFLVPRSVRDSSKCVPVKTHSVTDWVLGCAKNVSVCISKN